MRPGHLADSSISVLDVVAGVRTSPCFSDVFTNMNICPLWSSSLRGCLAVLVAREYRGACCPSKWNLYRNRFHLVRQSL